MSALGLVSGRICGEIATRPTKNGGQVTFFKIKVTNGNATEFWSISTFSDTVREELSGLQDGDSVSVVGALSVELFEWKGEQRISHKLLADRALALKPKPKTEKAPRVSGRDIADASWAAPQRGGGPNDDLPF
jgi:hypothetical protein